VPGRSGPGQIVLGPRSGRAARLEYYISHDGEWKEGKGERAEGGLSKRNRH
jgi:hypothetical protein